MYCKKCNVFVKYYKQNATKINKIQKKKKQKRTIVLHEPFRIDRNKATKEIVTKSMDKTYKLVFEKGVVTENETRFLTDLVSTQQWNIIWELLSKNQQFKELIRLVR